MRHLVLPAALAVALLAAPMALAATYSSDATYTFPGQSMSNSGRGIAVNSADTRLYETVRNINTGGVQILDTNGGAVMGSIAPAFPATINDIALSPDGSKVYLLRLAATGTDWEVDSAPASDGAHTAADVTTIVPSLGNTPGGIATIASGSTVYMAVVTNSDLQIYTSVSGAAFTKQSTVTLPFTTRTRDVAALDTGAGIRFYVLTPGTTPQTAILVYSAAGAPVSTTWSALPSAFTGFTIDSVTAAGPVDGVPSLFLASDGADSLGNPVMTVFRYGFDGLYKGDGFGYILSGASPLKDLQPMDTSPTLAPGAVVNGHCYLGVALPDTLGNAVDQTVRVVISASTTVPGTINGTVDEAAAGGYRHSEGAKVVIGGVDAPLATTGADGTYTLTPVNPGTLTLGASKFGYVSSSGTVALASGQTATAGTISLPATVPAFTLMSTFAPPIIDGRIFQGEYRGPAMPLYTLGGGIPAASVETTAWAMWDGTDLYVAVIGLEPSITFNTAAYGNQNMLTFDDNVQIYLDPPHRHDEKGTWNNLVQFAVNIPGLFAGQPVSEPLRFQRRINADGTGAETVPASAWWTRLGYFSGGWMLEARITFDGVAPFNPPAPNSVWGLLVARHRPTSHLDSLPVDYSTSDAQSGRLTDSTTWTDVVFGPAVTTVAGDVNRNGVLDANDIVYALRMAAGLDYGVRYAGDPSADPNPNLTIRNAVLPKADVWPAGAPDGKITLADAVRLARAMDGLDALQ